MYVLLAVLSVPSLIAILNTLAIGVIERTREIGMLRAIGAARGQVRRMIVAEALSAGGDRHGLRLAGRAVPQLCIGAGPERERGLQDGSTRSRSPASSRPPRRA